MPRFTFCHCFLTGSVHAKTPPEARDPFERNRSSPSARDERILESALLQEKNSKKTCHIKKYLVFYKRNFWRSNRISKIFLKKVEKSSPSYHQPQERKGEGFL